jgi:hypothetical protein
LQFLWLHRDYEHITRKRSGRAMLMLRGRQPPSEITSNEVCVIRLKQLITSFDLRCAPLRMTTRSPNHRADGLTFLRWPISQGRLQPRRYDFRRLA